MKKLSPLSRIILAVASLCLIITYFVPAWYIFLIAPQYPEGLTMQIWLNRITGEVDIINGLNHYIGMKHISAEMFPEFSFLVYIVAGFIAMGLITALTGSRKLLISYVILLLIGGAAALVDFYLWGYNYGHNLDPKAPIQVPGLYYQPPVIGHKKLLNFDAYSYPDTGGWVVVGVGLVFCSVLFFEWRKNRQRQPQAKVISSRKLSAAVLLISVTASSCSTSPEPFQYGKDACEFCNMSIMTGKFGGEIITRKGKLYKFDDLHCMAAFLQERKLSEKEIQTILTADYNRENHFLDINTAFFVTAHQLRSPMNSQTAGLSNREEANKLAATTSGSVTSWKDLIVKLK
jgi:copper chaperone NosL